MPMSRLISCKGLTRHSGQFSSGKEGLLDLQSKMRKNATFGKHMKEKQRYIAEALLLDIDGVVTDPSEKRITNQALLDIFVTRLQREEIVSFNSGRALSWIEKEVLGPLQQKLQENG